MRPNGFGILFALFASALIGWGISLLTDNPTQALICGIGTFVSLSCTLALAFGVSYEYSRSGTNIKLIATIFTVVFIVSNLIFVLLHHVSVPAYVIVNGLLLSIFALLSRSVFKSKV